MLAQSSSWLSVTPYGATSSEIRPEGNRDAKRDRVLMTLVNSLDPAIPQAGFFITDVVNNSLFCLGLELGFLSPIGVNSPEYRR